jgi:hypothetical protein
MNRPAHRVYNAGPEIRVDSADPQAEPTLNGEVLARCAAIGIFGESPSVCANPTTGFVQPLKPKSVHFKHLLLDLTCAYHAAPLLISSPLETER